MRLEEMRGMVLAALFAVAIGLGGVSAAQAEARLALLIGNQDYPSDVGRLSRQPNVRRKRIL